jgi:hypothetical protein
MQNLKIMIVSKQKIMMILVYTITILIATSCYLIKYNRNETHLLLKVSYPIFVKNNINNLLLDDTIHIYQRDSTVLYKFIPSRNFNDNSKIKFTENYFAYKIGDKQGIFFRNPNSNISNYSTVNTDSVLKSYAYGDLKFNIDENYVLQDSSTSLNSNLIEVYSTKNKLNKVFDTAYFYYKKNQWAYNIFSFSRDLDSIKKLKLYKVKLIANKNFSTIENIEIPKKEYLFELQKVRFESDSMIEKLFDKISKNKK